LIISSSPQIRERGPRLALPGPRIAHLLKIDEPVRRAHARPAEHVPVQPDRGRDVPCEPRGQVDQQRVRRWPSRRRATSRSSSETRRTSTRPNRLRAAGSKSRRDRALVYADDSRPRPERPPAGSSPDSGRGRPRRSRAGGTRGRQRPSQRPGAARSSPQPTSEPTRLDQAPPGRPAVRAARRCDRAARRVPRAADGNRSPCQPPGPSLRLISSGFGVRPIRTPRQTRIRRF